MKQTQKSDKLYNEVLKIIDKNKKGMTTYQIIGVLMSVVFRFWQLNTGQLIISGKN